MTFTIFFATSTGKTEDVADRLKELLPGAEAKDVDNLGSSDELVAADALVCCVPTWNTGADEGRSGTAWDDLAQEIPNLDFAGKSVAILGLGDSAGYTFDSSKSVVDGKFCGLPIDEDNESELSDQRLADWVQQINSEA